MALPQMLVGMKMTIAGSRARIAAVKTAFMCGIQAAMANPADTPPDCCLLVRSAAACVGEDDFKVSMNSLDTSAPARKISGVSPVVPPVMVVLKNVSLHLVRPSAVAS